jgi:hypothetical protein
MHPIEHLRYVARARNVDASDLVREAAVALGSLRTDGPNLVIACRRIVERHPEVGPLWWLCARMLTSDDPRSMAWTVADELECSPAADLLAAAIPDAATVVTIGRPATAEAALVQRADVRVLCVDAGYAASGMLQRLERADVECEPVAPEALAHAVSVADLVIVEAMSASPRRVLSPIGSRVLAAVASQQQVPVWCAIDIGRRLPAEYVDEIASRVLPAGGWDPRHDTEIDELPVQLITRVAGIDGVTADVAMALRPECAMAPELLRISPI